MTPLSRIAVTTGDSDGIGLEVSTKALIRVGPKKGVQFVLWRSPGAPKRDLSRLDRVFQRVTVTSWPEALSHFSGNPKELIDIASPQSPADWVRICAQAADFGHLNALATAPLSKTLIVEDGKEIGHTGILKKVTRRQDLFMCFVGKEFSVVLATDHVPIKKVSQKLTEEALTSAILAAEELAHFCSPKSRKPIAVLGLNPHSGEEGLLGQEEEGVFKAVLTKLRKKNLLLEGPLVPDVAFKKENWKKYAVFVAAYHDQGLIPFKMVHGFKGVHLTAGLPFVRTSVDHGTAKDLFGKNRADYSSMVEAIKWAIQLSQKGIAK